MNAECYIALIFTFFDIFPSSSHVPTDGRMTILTCCFNLVCIHFNSFRTAIFFNSTLIFDLQYSVNSHLFGIQATGIHI
jgi:hypothetical protein